MGFTFKSIIEKARDRKLAQPESAFYDDPFMLDIAIDATSDMAYRLSFPVKRSEPVLLGPGEDEVSPPADMLANGIHDVLFNDLGLERANSFGDLRMNSSIGENPEFYYWNPLMPPQLLLAPASADGGYVTVVYEAALYVDSAGDYHKPSLDSEVWGQTRTGSEWKGGLYPDLEEVAVLATTIEAWRAGVQIDKADYYEQRYEARLQATAQKLGVMLRTEKGPQ